jgi:putative transposase
MAGRGVGNGSWRGASSPLEDEHLPAALRHDRITAPFVFDRAIISPGLRAYVEQAVAPLEPGDIVIMDKLGAYKMVGCAKPSRRVGHTFSICRPTHPT